MLLEILLVVLNLAQALRKFSGVTTETYGRNNSLCILDVSSDRFGTGTRIVHFFLFLKESKKIYKQHTVIIVISIRKQAILLGRSSSSTFNNIIPQLYLSDNSFQKHGEKLNTNSNKISP